MKHFAALALVLIPLEHFPLLQLMMLLKLEILQPDKSNAVETYQGLINYKDNKSYI